MISPGRESLTELPGALERWEEQVFEVQELQESAGAGSRHTRGHLDGSLGIVGSDRIVRGSRLMTPCVRRCWHSSSPEQVQE